MLSVTLYKRVNKYYSSHIVEKKIYLAKLYNMRETYT